MTAAINPRADGFLFGACRLAAAIAGVALWVAHLVVDGMGAVWAPTLLLVASLGFLTWRGLRRDIVAATLAAVAVLAALLLGAFLGGVVTAVAVAVIGVILSPFLLEFVAELVS